MRFEATPAPWVAWNPAVLDALGQQAAWWGAVLLARSGPAWAAPLPPLGVVAAHVVLRPDARATIVLAAAGALVGFVGDSIVAQTGLLDTGGSAPLGSAWLSALWAAFALALGVSLRFVLRSPWWARALMAAVAGPLAVLAGHAMGALELAPWPSGPAAVALQWAITVPLLSWIAARAERERGPGETR